MRLTPKQLVYLSVVLTALILDSLAVAEIVFCVASCTVAPAPISAHAPSNSPTGLDSGILAVKDGQFWVSAYFHTKYLAQLIQWETRLRTQALWPDSPEDGFTGQPDGTYLCRRDTMERNNRMAEWTRDAQAMKP